MNSEMHPNAEIIPEGERRCPICEKTMTAEMEYGIQIDVCEEHGFWLDKGELGKLKGELLSHTSSSMDYLADEAKREERKKGIIFGWLSLSMD
jgi:Zn-finger nucleic acid-binding protein